MTPRTPHRWPRTLAITWSTCLLAVLACYAIWPRTIDVHAERGPIERAQFVLWCGSFVVGLAAMSRARVSRDFLSSLWLTAVAAIAALREVDAHQLVTSDDSPLPPIHFRADWFADPSAPAGAKVFWIVAALLAAAALIAPVALLRTPTRRLLALGDPSTWLLIISAAMLGAGYALDDILGRGRLGIHEEITQGLEEVAELLAATAFLLGAISECRTPLSARLERHGLPAPNVTLAPRRHGKDPATQRGAAGPVVGKSL